MEARIDLQRRFSTSPTDYLRWLLQHMHIPAGARVLEVGAGSGELWVEGAEVLDPSWRICF